MILCAFVLSIQYCNGWSFWRKTTWDRLAQSWFDLNAWRQQIPWSQLGWSCPKFTASSHPKYPAVFYHRHSNALFFVAFSLFQMSLSWTLQQSFQKYSMACCDLPHPVAAKDQDYGHQAHQKWRLAGGDINAWKPDSVLDHRCHRCPKFPLVDEKKGIL